MVLPRVTGFVFAAGVLAIGTLAGATAFSSSFTARTWLALASRRQPVVAAVAVAPRDPKPAYLMAADELWARTHDPRALRKLLQGALTQLARSDRAGERALAASATLHGEDDAEVPGDSLGSANGAQLIPVAEAAIEAPLAVFKLRRPVAISTSSGADGGRHPEWRQQMAAWRARLQKVPAPLNGAELSAIEIAIETF